MVAHSRIAVVNTLGGALAHYTRALVHDLEQAGSTVSVISISEPSKSGGSSLRWLGSYLLGLRAARRAGSAVIVTWPLLGFLDMVIVRAVVGRSGVVVVHDPQPLVHARGYDRFSRILATWLSRATFLVHSEQALSAIEPPQLRRRAQIIAHPMMAPTPRVAARSAGAIRVLGQYKLDRDVRALEDIGAKLDGYDLEIVGRGWPSVAGWRVEPAFVAEDRFEELVSNSAAVLIPYRRFFQSGVAIRCLELGTPVVGPAGSSLDDLLGETSPLLARDEWVSPVRFAVAPEGPQTAVAAARRWYTRCLSEWDSFVRGDRGV